MRAASAPSGRCSAPTCNCDAPTDVAAAIEELRAGGFDDVDEMFEESLLNPMDADAVARLFEQGVTS